MELIIRLPNRKFLKEMFGDQSGKLVCVYWGLKGSESNNFVTGKLRRSSAGAEKGLIYHSLHEKRVSYNHVAKKETLLN